MHTFEKDNFDADRYGEEISPTAFPYDRHAAFFQFFSENVESFYRARQLLVDDDSLALFDQLILFRLLGHLHVRLPFNTPAFWSLNTVADQWKIGNGLDGLTRFSVPVDGGKITVDSWHGNVAQSFVVAHYCFSRAELVAPMAGDHVIDAGACLGDTALVFAHTTGERGRVYSFDPIAKHCDIARRNFGLNPILASRIELFPFGVSDHDQDGAGDIGRDGRIDPGARIGSDVATRTIDGLVAEGAISRVDFIKMDVEGSELAALMGAEQAIRRWKPRLAISLYHRIEDFFAIPLWLDALGVGYRFFLDHYSIHNEETVLYARAP
jgi:FkbM family methyltransferase